MLWLQAEHGPHRAAAHALAPRVFAAHAQRDAHVAELPAPRLLDLRADRPASAYTTTNTLYPILHRYIVF